MNCFDCSTDGRTTPAVGSCITCGAGICAAHLELITRELPHTNSPGGYTPKMTRTLTCASCASVLTGARSRPQQPAHLHQ